MLKYIWTTSSDTSFDTSVLYLLQGTLLDRNPTAAGFTFMSYLYIKDWGRVEKNNGSDIVQYFNRTHAVYTREKNIFIPTRVVPGSVNTHQITPKSQFTRYVLIDFSLSVKAATLIFISWRGSAFSSAKQGKSCFIYNLVKNK